MGIINVTPDSFSDGGRYLNLDAAVRHGLDLAAQGADVLDVGGESTRPGSEPPSLQEEIDRVIPVVEALQAEVSVPISVDTSRAEVIRLSAAAGAAMINDVRALRCPGAISAVAQTGQAVCLMHMKGTPSDMQLSPQYSDVVKEVSEFLSERAKVCNDSGIRADRIMIDPGFGFGKTLTHNLNLLRHLPDLLELGYPLLIGLSRKGMLGTLSGVVRPEQRLAASLAGAALGAWLGAHIVRVHDVKETVEALAVIRAVAEVEA